jgi:hypothetical protein
MKNRYKILIIIVIVLVVFFTVTFERRYEAINAFYLSTQIYDKEKLCNTLHGKCDFSYSSCDFVEDVKCLAIGGETLSKPDEWRCLDVNNCVMYAMDIPTCHFGEQENEK